MIIDAMDLFYSGAVDGFCLVSSDSDYTRLATRIREQGIFVMGIGKKQTPRAFVNACDLFVYTENLMPAEPAKPEQPAKTTRRKRSTKSRAEEKDNSTPNPIPLLKKAFDLAAQDNGWHCHLRSRRPLHRRPYRARPWSRRRFPWHRHRQSVPHRVSR